MKVYLDTGFFIDYDSARNPVAISLRVAGRRNRSLRRVQTDAATTMDKLRLHHSFTSTLAVIEYERAMFYSLHEMTRGVSSGQQNAEALSKFYAGLFLDIVCRQRHIRVIPLPANLIRAASVATRASSLELRDAIHLECAIGFDCDMIISPDEHFHRLDRRITISGRPVRIVDTNVAVRML